jgi:AcrR family transcriptional regulator
VLETETRERVYSQERARIIEALIEVAAEQGYAGTTVEMIVERAGVDRTCFEHHFRGRYDCFISAWQEINEECMEEIQAAFHSAVDWPDRLRAVTAGIVGAMRRDPERAAFAIEVLAAGNAARARRDMTMRVIASLIDAGRREMDDPNMVSHTTAEALAGSAYGQIYAKVARGRLDELPTLVPQLMATAVMPYLGHAAAMEELSRGPSLPETSLSPEAAGSEGCPVLGPDGYPPELSRLPAGRHGLPRRFVARNQRERLIAGIADAVAENGYGGATIAQIARHAAVSRRTFYEHFESKEECFVAAYETVMEELREQVSHGFEEAEDWAGGIRAGIAAMLRFLAAEPALARLCMVEALVAGPVVVERYDAAIKSFAPYFRAGRVRRAEIAVDGNGSGASANRNGGPGANGGESLSPATEEALVGGMVSLISRRVMAGEAEQLEALLPDLVEFVLTPYLGSSEALQVATEG